MRQIFARNSLIKLALIGGTALVAPATARAQTAPAAEAEDAATDIVVTGFRASLEKALNLKRESVSAIDAIVAEDIAKFPDQNLAESLQRIPGISIQRDGGEGRSINVRGLGPQFTRVRVNGMETVATSADGASASRERGFDFNVFASELFSSLVVHKTPEAALDEGSLGAVIDLNTGNPLAGKAGLHGALSVVGSYNTLSSNVGPRLAGLLSWRNDAGTFGVSVSAAYSKTKTLELGNNTVRWAQALFNSVGGTRCYTTNNIGGTYVPSAGCNEVGLAFHPRIPRYGSVGHDRQRLGLTGSIQWEPSDRTHLSIDGLYSRFKETREEKWLEVLFRGNERATDVVSYTYDARTNNLVSGTFNNAYVRTEHYLRKQDTKFYQLSANLKQEFSDTFRVELLGGVSKSNADIPVETTIMLDDKEAQGFRYDYANSRSPLISFGSSVTDPANFQLSEIRDRPSNNTNKFRTLSLKAKWDFSDSINLEAGGVYRRYSFNLTEAARDTFVCPTGQTVPTRIDVVLGTINCTQNSGAAAVFGSTAVYGFPVTASLVQAASLGNAGQPSGATSSFIIADLTSAAAFTNLYGRTAVPNNSQIRSVIETDKGAYLQVNAKGELLGARFALNAGVRYMVTNQSSTGIQASGATVGPVTVQRQYTDWLPSMNLAIFPTDQLIVRFSASKVMTRPNLSQLTPGGTIDGFNYRISFGNPFLEPYRANAYDLSLEWYFAPQSVFSVAVFKKDISSLPIGASRTGTYASTGLPVSAILQSAPAFGAPEAQPWTITTFTNGTGGKIKGAEFSLSAPLKFLPGILRNTGVIANFTLLDSSYLYTVTGPSTLSAAGALVPPAGVTVINQLPNLAKKAFNFTLWYEDAKFGARASYSYRSGFVESTSATGNVFEGYNGISSLDASIRYKITPNIELSVEGNNLTDAYRDRFTDQAANRNYEYNHFGRTILFGARLKM